MNNTIRPDLNRPETKAQYFTQYYGQRCRFWTVNGPESLSKNTTFTKALVKYSTLLLTSLANITDEDAVEVAKILRIEEDLDDEDTAEHNRWSMIRAVKQFIDGDLISNYALQAYDYLRSKGYALPWMGYTVEELIAAGYCQLRKEGGESE